MKFDTNRARRDLFDKIRKVKADKQQRRTLKKTNDETCSHNWKIYKQIIYIDHEAEIIEGQLRNYCGPSSPYFVVKGCNKCKSKQYIDMRSV